jgi:hypothetical protein
MAEVIVPVATIGCGVFLTYSIKNKYKYKKIKENIYKDLKSALNILDPNKILNALINMQEFDVKYEDKRSFKDAVLRRKKQKKINKINKMFGVNKENFIIKNNNKEIVDLAKINLYCENEKKNKQERLKKISEEKNKITLKQQILINGLEKNKQKILEKNINTRKVLDNVNLTEIIDGIHQQYINYIRNNLRNDVEITKILNV